MSWEIEITKNDAYFVNKDACPIVSKVRASHNLITDMVKNVIPEGDACSVIPFGESMIRTLCVNCGDGWCVCWYEIDPNFKRLLSESNGLPTTHNHRAVLISYEDVKAAANEIESLKALQIGGQDG